MDCNALYASPLGRIVLTANANALTGLRFEDQLLGRFLPPTAPQDPGHPILAAAQAWLDAWFAAKPLPALPPLSPSGTDFQRRVWALLPAIAYGQTCTYGALAAALGQPRAAQAVGRALGQNPLLIVLPCHRVLAANGALCGYAAGLDRKQALLAHEREHPRDT